MQYAIVEVPLDAPSQLEQLGSKAKFWFRSADDVRTLFKEGYPGSGEHWAEKVACEVARGLGLPHAEYELAFWNGRAGVISPTIVPQGGRLIHGNELLARVVPEYEETKQFRASQHTLTRVVAVLRSPRIGPPLGWARPPEVENAVGVFLGYLLMDALIGNQDRHHENWGLIKLPNASLTLAPTFDHASSLGRNETDAARMERLTTNDAGRSVASYARRARSGLYKTHASLTPLTTFAAFLEGASMTPVAAAYWRSRLDQLVPAVLESIVGRVPSAFLSEPGRKFALALMLENRKRLLVSE